MPRGVQIKTNYDIMISNRSYRDLDRQVRVRPAGQGSDRYPTRPDPTRPDPTRPDRFRLCYRHRNRHRLHYRTVHSSCGTSLHRSGRIYFSIFVFRYVPFAYEVKLVNSFHQLHISSQEALLIYVIRSFITNGD